MKKMRFKIKYLIVLILFIGFLGCNSTSECELLVRNKSTDESFSGIIKDVYFKYSDGGRGTPTIILTDNSKIYTSTDRLICYAQEADSIIKMKGTLKYVLKRGDSTKIFYPDCGEFLILDSNKISYQSDHFNRENCQKNRE